VQAFSLKDFPPFRLPAASARHLRKATSTRTSSALTSVAAFASRFPPELEYARKSESGLRARIQAHLPSSLSKAISSWLRRSASIIGAENRHNDEVSAVHYLNPAPHCVFGDDYPAATSPGERI